MSASRESFEIRFALPIKVMMTQRAFHCSFPTNESIEWTKRTGAGTLARIRAPKTDALALPLEFVLSISDIMVDNKQQETLGPDTRCSRYYVKRILMSASVEYEEMGEPQYFWRVQTAVLLTRLGLSQIPNLNALA
jgi:hypothetical protein